MTFLAVLPSVLPRTCYRTQMARTCWAVDLDGVCGLRAPYLVEPEEPDPAKGLCPKHWHRWRRWGDPNKRVNYPWPFNLTERLERQPNGCLIWTGTADRNGYGTLKVAGRPKGVHVAAYELWVGPIPEGYEVDHLCHDETCTAPCTHRTCVEPSHLRAVTGRENTLRSNAPSAINARKTHCIRGHPFDEANTYQPLGRLHRMCRACARERRQRERSGG